MGRERRVTRVGCLKRVWRVKWVWGVWLVAWLGGACGVGCGWEKWCAACGFGWEARVARVVRRRSGGEEWQWRTGVVLSAEQE